MATAASPLAIMSGAGGTQTVPAGSQNLNPLGSASITNPNLGPITATLPGAQTRTSTGSLGTAPVAGVSTVGTTGTVPTGTTTTAGGFNPSAGVTNPSATTHSGGDYTLAGDFQQTYGQGVGTALSNVVSNLGTTTSTAEQNMIGSTMQAAQAGFGNIQAGESARGVSADSSTAALASGDYWGQVNQGIASETGQIGLQEENTLINTLMGEGAAHGSDVSGWSEFGNVMSGLGSAAMGVASLGTGLGTTVGGTLLSKIGL